MRIKCLHCSSPILLHFMENVSRTSIGNIDMYEKMGLTRKPQAFVSERGDYNSLFSLEANGTLKTNAPLIMIVTKLLSFAGTGKG